MRAGCLLFAFLYFGAALYAQNRDSLLNVAENAALADTSRQRAYHLLGKMFLQQDPDSSIWYSRKGLALSPDQNTLYKARLLNTIGIANSTKSNYPQALEHFLAALPIYENLNNKQGLGNCYTNVGVVYLNSNNYPKALECLSRSLGILKEIGDKNGEASCYAWIGIVYGTMKIEDKVLEYNFKALPLFKELKNKQGEASCYSSIGIVYSGRGEFTKALEYYAKHRELVREIQDVYSEAIGDLNMAALYNKKGDYKLAILYSDSALVLARQTSDIDTQRLAYESLALANSHLGNYKLAYENEVKFKQLTDTIFNEENSRQMGDMKTRFEVEKKEAEIRVREEAEREKLKAVAEEQNKKQNVIIGSVIFVLLLVVAFAIFIYNRLRISKRQKAIIEQQKLAVDKAYSKLHEKNKEVLDSIHYARRIQNALITSEGYIDSKLKKLRGR